MKKLSILLVLLMLFSIPAQAFTWEPVMGVEDTITITGQTASGDGEIVTLIILNPGYTFDDYAGDNDAKRKEAVQYIGFAVADGGSYTFDNIHITGGNGGEFTAYTQDDFISGSIPEGQSMIYYGKEYRQRMACKYDAGEATVEELLVAYSLAEKETYTANDATAVKKRIDSLKPIGNADYTKVDIEELYLKLDEVLLLAAFDAKNEDLLLVDGKWNPAYIDAMGIADSDEYDDYLNSLSDTGVKDVNDRVFAEDFASLSEIKAKFNELVYINLIMNNIKLGHGHIKPAIDKYKDEYAAEDVKYTSSVTREVLINLLDSGADTLEEIAKELKKKPSNSGSSNNSGTGSFGGGSPSFTPSVPGTVPDTNPPADPDNKDDEPTVPPVQSGSFTDVADGHWASEAIKALSDAGIVNGYVDKSFKPENTVTRAEFAKMIVSIMGLDITSKDTAFGDVTEADWFAPFVAAAAKAGIITGADGKFNPNDIITRQDAAIIMARAAGIEATGETTFTDSDEIADYAKDAAAAVQESGLMNGVGEGKFAPLDSLTRAQAATVLYRLNQRGVK